MQVGTDVYNDAKRIALSIEKFYDFVEKYVYVTDGDIELEKLTSEIDSITIGLMYAGEHLQEGDLQAALETLSDITKDTQNPVLES